MTNVGRRVLDRHNVIALGEHIDQLREVVHREAAVRVALELRLHARQRHVFAAPHRVMKDEHVLRRGGGDERGEARRGTRDGSECRERTIRRT